MELDELLNKAKEDVIKNNEVIVIDDRVVSATENEDFVSLDSKYNVSQSEL